ncbi:recombinase family protein [Fundicoccus culcitae]|uniref:Recombinase family protein n=1 Tax=Fundicoccus culcitae TaxID=2969821 RepID=A0ABY5P3G5_9LACT|nr:recombinase family protein [Fundicoccus culcitae]UUX33263.1 recombinase family protein [Fundicoccus culcitae]
MEMSKTIRAVYYTRVSTAEQAISGYSLGAQKKVINDYCQQKGYLLVGGYSDEGISGKSIENRYQLQDLLDDSKEGLFDVVIIWKLSRLSRRLIDTISIIEELQENNVGLESISEKTDFTSSTGWFMTQVMASMNEFERNVIAENVSLGHKSKALNGEWNGNRVLGYDNLQNKTHKNTLVVNQDEAKIIKHIYNSYIGGMGLRAIANDLNQQGYVTKKGNPFSSVAVKDILENPVYCGDIVYGRNAKNIKELQGNPIKSKGKHEAIIDKTTWNKVAQLREIRSRNPEKSRTGANILTGIIKCPQCGGHMVINNSYYKKKDGTKVHKKYYVCGTFKNKGSSVCRGNGINAEIAEQKVADRLEGLLNSPDLIKHLLTKMKEENTVGKEQLKRKRLKTTEKIIKIQNNVLVYQEKIESEPDFSDIWQEAILRLKSEITELQNEILALDKRLEKDFSDYDINQVVSIVNRLVRLAKGTKNKEVLKDIYLAFIKEIQWNKNTEKFDILLCFNEANIAEYLKMNPSPDPNDSPQINTPKIESDDKKNLQDGRFFLRSPIEFWI